MYRQPLSLPVNTLNHLRERELAAHPELLLTQRLLEGGWAWRGAALAPELEEQFYRLNNLPRQLAAVYAELDPADPDEDIVEEAEERALALVARHYLLDETIDAIYEVYDRLGGAITLRRPGEPDGRLATHQRAALLELKKLFQDDWRSAVLLTRLALTGSLAIDARTVLLHPASGRPDADASARAAALLGLPVEVWLDDRGGLTHVLPA